MFSVVQDQLVQLAGVFFGGGWGGVCISNIAADSVAFPSLGVGGLFPQQLRAGTCYKRI